MKLKFEVDVNLNVRQTQESELLKWIKLLNNKLDQILEAMAKNKQDFDALNERFSASHTAISESLTNLADDVRRLTEGMTPTGGLTEQEATEVFTALEQKAEQIESVASQIRALADQTPEPNPETPTNPENPEQPLL